jgi:transposase
MRNTDYAGIEVSMKELEVRVEREGKAVVTVCFDNTASGHKKLVRFLRCPGRTTRVAAECTGVYSTDMAMALSDVDGIELMLANPRSVRDFARAMLKRSKSDKVDAAVLVEYARKMPFRRFAPPPAIAAQLRSISREVKSLIKQTTRDRNRLHATGHDSTASATVAKVLKKAIKYNEKLIAELEDAAAKLIESEPELERKRGLLITVPGIASRSAAQILGEIACLPRELSTHQLTAIAGLDPVHRISGQSVNRKCGISRQGNKNLREALFMPAMIALQRQPNVRAFYMKLLERGKPKMVAIVAVMRKLLHSIWGMLLNNQPFDGDKFYRIPGTLPA